MIRKNSVNDCCTASSLISLIDFRFFLGGDGEVEDISAHSVGVVEVVAAGVGVAAVIVGGGGQADIYAIDAIAAAVSNIEGGSLHERRMDWKQLAYHQKFRPSPL